MWRSEKQLKDAMAAVRELRRDEVELDSALNATELESYAVAGATLHNSGHPGGSVQPLCLQDFRRFKSGRGGEGSYLCTRGFSAVGHLMSASPNVEGSDRVFVLDEGVQKQLSGQIRDVTVGCLLRACQVSHRTPYLT